MKLLRVNLEVWFFARDGEKDYDSRIMVLLEDGTAVLRHGGLLGSLDRVKAEFPGIEKGGEAYSWYGRLNQDLGGLRTKDPETWARIEKGMRECFP